MLIWRYMQLAGMTCLAIVVLTHIAERFAIFPSMGWGRSDSPGHYLDLVSAILGCALVPMGLIGNVIARWKNSN